MNQTYIETNNNRSLFSQQLKKELVSKNVELVSSKADATSILKIFEDETGRRVLSVSARNIATEYEVFYRIVFGLEEDGKLLSPPREIILTRSYTFDERLVLGKSQEEEMLIEALAGDLVRMVLNQLSSK
jgi:outer membrane lipopolysaccharide assembly protein LptE/RlpB